MKWDFWRHLRNTEQASCLRWLRAPLFLQFITLLSGFNELHHTGSLTEGEINTETLKRMKMGKSQKTILGITGMHDMDFFKAHSDPTPPHSLLRRNIWIKMPLETVWQAGASMKHLAGDWMNHLCITTGERAPADRSNRYQSQSRENNRGQPSVLIVALLSKKSSPVFIRPMLTLTSGDAAIVCFQTSSGFSGIDLVLCHRRTQEKYLVYVLLVRIGLPTGHMSHLLIYSLLSGNVAQQS